MNLTLFRPSKYQKSIIEAPFVRHEKLSEIQKAQEELPSTSKVHVYSHRPKPQLAIGAYVRILYGKHQDKWARIVSSVWEPKAQVWLYYVKSGQTPLGEYALEELG